MLIRRAEEKDLDTILKLNNSESDWVGAQDRSFFEWCLTAPFFYVAEIDNGVIGFLTYMDEKSDYESGCFSWAKKNLKEFYCADRTVVDPAFKKKGVGIGLYKKLFSNIKENIPLITEVSINPPNNCSIRFHEKLGFREIGTCEEMSKTYIIYRLR